MLLAYRRLHKVFTHVHSVAAILASDTVPATAAAFASASAVGCVLYINMYKLQVDISKIYDDILCTVSQHIV